MFQKVLSVAFKEVSHASDTLLCPNFGVLLKQIIIAQKQPSKAVFIFESSKRFFFSYDPATLTKILFGSIDYTFALNKFTRLIFLTPPELMRYYF